MNRPLEPQPRQRRDRVRYQARLDAETQATLEDLVKTLHRKRGQILRQVMQRGLTHGDAWTIDSSSPASPSLVPMLLDPTLQQQVHNNAAAHGVSTAAWVRHALREVTLQDFPASWRAEETPPRSHESGDYHRKLGMRLDEGTSQKLDTLCRILHRSVAAVIRQLIAQARPEDFPRNWQLAAEERQPLEGRRVP